MTLDLSQQRIVVTGGAGFLGKNVCAKLAVRGCKQVLVPEYPAFDFTKESEVARMYAQMKPNVVIHLAAVVGGIGANREHPGLFFFSNMAMGMHLIEHARINKIKKFVHTGTVCAYPKFAPVPFNENDLWNGYPEETNAPYGVAKKALFVMLDGYKREYGLDCAVVVPVNLYGPGDNFNPASSHVIPALIRKCEDARLDAQRRGDAAGGHIDCWGTGAASREFLYVEDAAEGIVRITERIDTPDPINLGTGREITIKNLVELIARLCDFKGRIVWDPTKPDGQPRRCLDTARAKKLLDWTAGMSFEEGLKKTIEWWRKEGVNR